MAIRKKVIAYRIKKVDGTLVREGIVATELEALL